MERGRVKFQKYKKYLLLFTKCYSVLPLKIRLKLFEMHRNTKGYLGIGLRYAILKAIAFECGDNVVIYPGAYILNPQYLSLGDNISIHPMCYIECGKYNGNVSIKDNVSIAHGTTIMGTTHTYEAHDVCIRDQKVISKPVEINSDVWIGAKATVLAGIKIEHGCVIGANTVVTKDTDEYGIYAGTPAKLIKMR